MAKAPQMVAGILVGLILIEALAGCGMIGRQVTPTPMPTPPARTLEDFAFLQLGMSYQEVVRVVGPADESVGSGLTIYGYSLSDGSGIVLNFGPDGESLWRALLVRPDGTREIILGGE